MNCVSSMSLKNNTQKKSLFFGKSLSFFSDIHHLIHSFFAYFFLVFTIFNLSFDNRCFFFSTLHIILFLWTVIIIIFFQSFMRTFHYYKSLYLEEKVFFFTLFLCFYFYSWFDFLKNLSCLFAVNCTPSLMERLI